MANNIPITQGTGASSVAAETVAGVSYQQIEVYGGGGASVLSVNPDGSFKASIIGTPSFTMTGNPSVSGTVGASVIGIVPINIVAGGSSPGIINPTGDLNPAGVFAMIESSLDYLYDYSASVFTRKPGTSSIGALVTTGKSSVITVLTGNPSVSGTVGASIIGQLPAGNAILGAVAASISGTVTTIVTGTPSVSGTVNIGGALIPPGSVSGAVTAPPGSVMTIATLAGSIMSVSATAPAGSVMATNQIAGSVMAVSATQGTTPWTIGSVYGNISGSVAATITNTNINVGGSVVAFQGTTPWAETIVGSVITIQTGSVISTSIGSVIAVIQASSIVGTYAEDAASATSDKGLFVLGARNDTLSSVTSADLDYSGIAVGAVGEVITANAPITKWVRGTASMLGGLPTTGVLVPVIAAQGASVFTYITGIQVANPSATNAWVTFLSAGTPIGYTAAPANGGSNIVLPNALRTTDNVAFNASVSAVSSVYVTVQGFISKT